MSCSSSLVTNLGRVRNSLSGGNAESKNVLDGIAPVTLFLYSCSLIFLVVCLSSLMMNINPYVRTHQSTCGQLVHYLTLPPYLPPTGKLPSARVRLRKLLGGVHRARVNEITMWSILRNVILRRERHRGPQALQNRVRHLGDLRKESVDRSSYFSDHALDSGLPWSLKPENLPRAIAPRLPP